MAVSVQRTPIRVSTYQTIRKVIWFGGAAIGAIAAVGFGEWTGLFAALPAWLIAFYVFSLQYPEPALDEWDKIPKEQRLAMVKMMHPSAMQLAEYDRDREVKEAWHAAMHAIRKASKSLRKHT